MKLLKVLALALPLAGAGLVAETSGAEARVTCVAEAFRANGAFVRRTHAEATARYERRACRRAIRRCSRRLNEVRYRTGRRMPRARCEVVNVFGRHGRPGRPHRPPYRW